MRKGVVGISYKDKALFDTVKKPIAVVGRNIGPASGV